MESLVVNVRAMEPDDVSAAAAVHREAFVRQCRSLEWIGCNLSAFPRMLCYVAVSDGVVVGYIIWTQKSGFRPEVVLGKP
jgi:hypothetical protein